MISSASRIVRILITTFKVEDVDTIKAQDTMDRRQIHQDTNPKTFCPICFNKTGHKGDCGKRLARDCTICRKNYTCDHNSERRNNTHSKAKDLPKNSSGKESHCLTKDPNTKNVQTSQTDLTQDLSLLKEVLTVFQSKKQLNIQPISKTVVMKDVSVETESKTNIELKAKLTKSRTFQFSIEEEGRTNGNNFKIVNYSQPYNIQAEYSIDLKKHKSSSIPQMKMEELKYSLKEKTKSKDAIEEVNRMFATVKRSDLQSLEENRPMIRNGPRVLPVVKTKTYNDPNVKESDCEFGNVKKLPSSKTKTYQNKVTDEMCKCCQTNNLELSGGDSFFKHECCYHKMLAEGRCEKCIYMLCCHHEKHNKTETGSLMCECSNNVPEKLENGSEEHELCECNHH